MTASAGTVELVDAALAPYLHADLRWLVRRHVFAVLREFPSLSPSVDAYTSDDGASAVLLNARGHLAISSAAGGALRLLVTLWLPREYPYRRPLVYALPAAPRAAALVPDHPFVDHRTGQVRAAALPYLDRWRVPESSLVGLLRSLLGAFRMCHPLTVLTTNLDAGGTVAAVASRASRSPEEERDRLREVLAEELVARLGADAAAFRDRVHEDIQNAAALQARLAARAAAADRAVRELEEERMRLERAVTASLAYRGELTRWLRETTSRAGVDGEAGTTVLEPLAAAGGADAERWLESKAAELGLDDAIDALGRALEGGALGFQDYIRLVKVIAREQFFHCYAASVSLNTTGTWARSQLRRT